MLRDSTQNMVFDSPPLSDEEFTALRDMLRKETGIALSMVKKNLMRTRLRKRLLALGCDTFAQYFQHLKRSGHSSEEMQDFINCITTNKTDFFRESHHFEYLTEHALPSIVASKSVTSERSIRVWSAGCSMGHEAYSLAITLSEYFADKPGWDVKILASDIDSECLQKAAAGVYEESDIGDLSTHLRKKYFLRGTGDSAGKVKAQRALADMITFRKINFASKPWPIRTKFDIVFCRNVIIYFDQQFQESLLKRFIGFLKPDGLLFLGHSESINWMPELTSLGQTIYQPSSSETSSNRRTTKRIVSGETMASDQQIEISTLLGSCVAVCLHDPVAGVGGMNHVMFADDARRQGGSSKSHSADYARYAMEKLLSEMITLGAKPSRMVAKLYGGAELLSRLRSVSGIGSGNIQAVSSLLQAKGIPIVEKRVGGDKPVRISMQPDTGYVTLDSSQSNSMQPCVTGAAN